MGTLYAPADVAVGSMLLGLNYTYASIAVVWVSLKATRAANPPDSVSQIYDYLLTLGDEVDPLSLFQVAHTDGMYEIAFILQAKWGKVKLLYLLCRYLPFVLLALDSFQVLQPTLPMSKCETYYELNSWLEGITLVSSECMFILRTYAIWERNRRVLLILMCSFFAFLIPVIFIMTKYDSSTIITEPPVPNITSCYNAGQNDVIVVAYVLLVVAELGMACLHFFQIFPIYSRIAEILLFTLYRSIKHYQDHGGRSQLLHILIQHNIFYFACGLFFSLLVILSIAFLPVCLAFNTGFLMISDISTIKDPYGDMTSNLQVTIHALLVTRMHLDLWKADRTHYVANYSDIPLPSLHLHPAPEDVGNVVLDIGLF
ncbi:hypothetical protein HYDPIDRAFT_26084 [Hydnomerulius pinastri MD-312]|nr:hypothetical protein HYDPIDRAFT_26084 [Hydnomerulius pinastri MD-312]